MRKAAVSCGFSHVLFAVAMTARTSGARAAVSAAGAFPALFVADEGGTDERDYGKKNDTDKKRTHGKRQCH